MLLPVYVKHIVIGDEKTLGILWGSAGVSALILASKKQFTNHKLLFIQNIMCCIG